MNLVRAVTLGLLNFFFYEAAYQPVAARDTPIPIHERGECVVAEEIPCEPSGNVPSVDSDYAQTPKSDSVPKVCKKWQECRPLSDSEVDTVADKCHASIFQCNLENGSMALVNHRR